MNPEILSLLSDEELRTLAEKMNIYVPEGLERIFLIEEIIDLILIVTTEAALEIFIMNVHWCKQDDYLLSMSL